jgi:hypothetical protein
MSSLNRSFTASAKLRMNPNSLMPRIGPVRPHAVLYERADFSFEKNVHQNEPEREPPGENGLAHGGAEKSQSWFMMKAIIGQSPRR